jgi:pimeloyl-ACP methyl ester carboxylesterase
MNKLRIKIFFLLVFLTSSDLMAQEPPAPNGKYAIVRGIRIYYEESGKGMPLILLNPFTGTCASWRPFTPELSKYFRVISVEIPGHGRSDAMDTSGIYSFRKAAEYVIGLIDFLKLDSFNIIGTSTPGVIGLYIATMQPVRVKNLVVIGSQAYFSVETRKVITSWGQGVKDSAWLAESIKTHGKEKGTQLLVQLWNFRANYGNPSLTSDILSTITAKTLIIHGDRDDIIPVSQAIEMYNNINKRYLWIVPNGGHLPYLDPSNQSEFLRILVGFLNGNWENK